MAGPLKGFYRSPDRKLITLDVDMDTATRFWVRGFRTTGANTLLCNRVFDLAFLGLAMPFTCWRNARCCLAFHVCSPRLERYFFKVACASCSIDRCYSIRTTLYTVTQVLQHGSANLSYLFSIHHGT